MRSRIVFKGTFGGYTLFDSKLCIQPHIRVVSLQQVLMVSVKWKTTIRSSLFIATPAPPKNESAFEIRWCKLRLELLHDRIPRWLTVYIGHKYDRSWPSTSWQIYFNTGNALTLSSYHSTNTSVHSILDPCSHSVPRLTLFIAYESLAHVCFLHSFTWCM